MTEFKQTTHLVDRARAYLADVQMGHSVWHALGGQIGWWLRQEVHRCQWLGSGWAQRNPYGRIRSAAPHSGMLLPDATACATGGPSLTIATFE